MTNLKTTLLVVRHGQDEDNASGILNGHRDNPLTELGMEQARTVGRKLKGTPVAMIFSSPLRRASQTAAIIAGEMGRPGEVMKKSLLIERDFGEMTGKPVAEIPIHATSLLVTDRVIYFLEPEHGETFPEVYARAEKIVAEMKQFFPGQTVLLVCHGDIAKMIQAVVKGWTWREGLLAPYVENTAVLELVVQV